MLVVMNNTATPEDVDRVCAGIGSLGFTARVIHVSSPYKQVNREWRSESTVIELPNVARLGDGSVTLFGGPCSVESEEQIHPTAAAVAAAGATMLRGGAFKPGGTQRQ